MFRDKNKTTFRLPLTALLTLPFTLVAPAQGHGPESFEDVPEGMVQAQITGMPDTPGLDVMLLEGEHQGILMAYDGDETLTLFGESGEPFLRFNDQGVEANQHSETWQTIDGDEQGAPRDDETQWRTVADSGRYAWMDPRLTSDEAPEATDQAQTLGDWHIHMERSDETSCQGISGAHHWYPLGTDHDSAVEAHGEHSH